VELVWRQFSYICQRIDHSKRFSSDSARFHGYYVSALLANQVAYSWWARVKSVDHAIYVICSPYEAVPYTAIEEYLAMKPEEKAREKIDLLLEAAGWRVQNYRDLNLGASLGVAVCEFPLKSGAADYLLFIDRKAAGIIEAKPEGTTLSGVSEQTGKYLNELPEDLPHYQEPLPLPMRARVLKPSSGIQEILIRVLEEFLLFTDPSLSVKGLRRKTHSEKASRTCPL